MKMSQAGVTLRLPTPQELPPCRRLIWMIYVYCLPMLIHLRK